MINTFHCMLDPRSFAHGALCSLQYSRGKGVGKQLENDSADVLLYSMPRMETIISEIDMHVTRLLTLVASQNGA